MGSFKYPASAEMLGNDVVVYNENSKTTVQISTPVGQTKIFEILDAQMASSSGNEIIITNSDGAQLAITLVLSHPTDGSLLMVTISDETSLSALVLAE